MNKLILYAGMVFMLLSVIMFASIYGTAVVWNIRDVTIHLNGIGEFWWEVGIVLIGVVVATIAFIYNVNKVADE